jgi:hypothetical protein
MKQSAHARIPLVKISTVWADGPVSRLQPHTPIGMATITWWWGIVLCRFSDIPAETQPPQCECAAQTKQLVDSGNEADARPTQGQASSSAFRIIKLAPSPLPGAKDFGVDPERHLGRYARAGDGTLALHSSHGPLSIGSIRAG